MSQTKGTKREVEGKPRFRSMKRNTDLMLRVAICVNGSYSYHIKV